MKRFTDTNKWDKPWFRKLHPTLKSFWTYACDRCDNAGVWVVDLELAEFYIGTPVKETEILSAFGDRIKPIGDGKWWLVGFIDFQAGELKMECKPHAAIIGTLKRHGIYTLYIEYAKGIQTPQEKERERDTEKDSQAPTEEQWTESTSRARIALGYLGQKSGARFMESASNLDPISERIFETGLDLDGIKKMIDRCVAMFKGDSVMEKCLTPRHLFGEKFHGYYGQRDMTPPQKNGATNKRNEGITNNLEEQSRNVVAAIAAQAKARIQ
jgi:uncharacterized phage protein (TIGR02220 family)